MYTLINKLILLQQKKSAQPDIYTLKSTNCHSKHMPLLSFRKGGYVINPLFLWYWSIVYDAGPTLKQQWINNLCWPISYTSDWLTFRAPPMRFLIWRSPLLMNLDHPFDSPTCLWMSQITRAWRARAIISNGWLLTESGVIYLFWQIVATAFLWVNDLLYLTERVSFWMACMAQL